MKFPFFKKDCDCGVGRNDLLMAIGAAAIAVVKAFSTYRKYKVTQDEIEMEGHK